MLPLRDVPGLPDADLRPPVVAESGDPFAAIRVVHLLARIPRGQAVRIRDIVDQLNATWLDWSFDARVVLDAVIQLQSNWTADYRTVDGIQVGSGTYGETVAIEDTNRVDPWMVLQVRALADACEARLREFAGEQEGA